MEDMSLVMGLIHVIQGCKRDVEVRDRDFWLPVRDETETEPLV